MQVISYVHLDKRNASCAVELLIYRSDWRRNCRLC